VVIMTGPISRYRVSVRLYLIFAVLMGVSATLSGLLLLYLARPFVVGLTPEQVRQATIILFSGAATAVVLAGLGGLLIGLGFAGRIRGIVRKAEAIDPALGEILDEQRLRVSDELGALDAAVGRLTLSMDRFVRDSDILARLPQGVCLLGPSGGLFSFNTTSEQILGMPLERYRGVPMTAPSGPFPLARGNETLHVLLEGADAAGKQADVNEVRVTLPEGRQMLLEVVLQRRDWRGGSTALIMLFRDASQKQLIRDQIRKADQLAFLGGMAARVAHEIRTPLATIRGLLELLEADLPAGDPRHAYIGRVLLSLDRQDKLVENLLTLSHPEPKTSQAVAIPDLIDEVRAMLPADPRLRVVVAGDAAEIPPAWGDPFRLHEVFANLVQNALQASPPDAVVEARVERGGQGRVRVIVRNTGAGIPLELRERIFQPFFTTKARGTGLGLAIARQIVEAHRGTLRLDSDGRTETVFTVELPSPAEMAAAG
jgi:two-component system sensor histidine kinase AtoS